VTSRWRTTRSCQPRSLVAGACRNTFVIGIGVASPSRRASAVAAASTPEESRPPEKLIKQGGLSRAGRMACSIACKGVQPVGGGSAAVEPTVPMTIPVAISNPDNEHARAVMSQTGRLDRGRRTGYPRVRRDLDGRSAHSAERRSFAREQASHARSSPCSSSERRKASVSTAARDPSIP
jgi:hypothetical protein